MSDEPNDNDPTVDDNDVDDPDAPPERTFTQAEVDKLTGKTRKQAAHAARKQLADELGISIDEAKQLIESNRQQREAEKTEAQRAREEADAAQRQAAEAIATAQRETLRARIATALVSSDGDDLPCRPERVEAAITLAVSGDLEGDDLDEQVTAAVGHVRAISPEWFSGSSSDDNNGTGDTEVTKTPPAPGRKPGERKQPPPKDERQERINAYLEARKSKDRRPFPAST